MTETPPNPPSATPEVETIPSRPLIEQAVIERVRHRTGKLERLKCWPEVLALLETGESVDTVCAFIQGTRGEYTEVGHDSLRRTIYNWLRRHRHLGLDRSPTSHIALLDSAPMIDELAGLNMLFALQMDRVGVIFESEVRQGTVNRLNNENIRLAKDILQAMTEVRAQRKRYTPLAPPQQQGQGGSIVAQLEQIKITYAAKYGSPAARVILNDESRRRVMNALEHVRKGNSEALQKILVVNEQRATALEEKERDRAAVEATETVDAEVIRP